MKSTIHKLKSLFWKQLLLCGAIQLCCIPVGASEPNSNSGTSSNCTIINDVEYAVVAGSPLLMTITIPAEKPRKPVPAIVFLHGGGWGGGERKSMLGRSSLASQNGYIGACVTYRLVGQAPFPAQIQDVKRAIRYLRANASKYSIDPDRIGVWGCSAGGHLAAMAGLTEDIAEFEGEGDNPGVSSAVQMVVDCYGPTDFETWGESIKKIANDEQVLKLFGAGSAIKEKELEWEKNFSIQTDGNIVKFFSGNPNPDYKWGSPLNYVKPGKKYPPFLIVHGTQDAWVPMQQSIFLANALADAGANIEFLLKPSMGHDESKAFPQIIEYIKKTFPIKGSK